MGGNQKRRGATPAYNPPPDGEDVEEQQALWNAAASNQAAKAKATPKSRPRSSLEDEEDAQIEFLRVNNVAPAPVPAPAPAAPAPAAPVPAPPRAPSPAPSLGSTSSLRGRKAILAKAKEKNKKQRLKTPVAELDLSTLTIA